MFYLVCGFPEESDEDYEETYQFLEKCKLPIVNIS